MEAVNRESSHFLVQQAYHVLSYWQALISAVQRVPGGKLVIDYIKASHKNDPWRTLLEALLFLVALRYFFAARYNQDDTDKMALSKREIDELIDEWVPEPIVPSLRDDERWQLQTNPEIVGAVMPRCTVVNPKNPADHIANVANFASVDFLTMSLNETVKARSVECVREVGVGACGPPNFYGTQSVHVRIREDLARFLGAQDSILYGQDYSGITTILPCFLKRGDIVVMDEGCNLALQKAAILSRCDIEWFDHNDMQHLEEIMVDLEADLKDGPLTRRFIVTEGLFENFGDSPDLLKLIEIKNRFKFRLILDETNSIGTLGANGRGLAEVFKVDRSDIEITIGSMARSFGSSGGFCAGHKDMIYHQILNSNGYVFSAALPPYCAVAASTSIKLLEDSETENKINPYIEPLAKNNQLLFDLFTESTKLAPYIHVRSASYSPSVHIRINPELRKLLNLPEFYGGPDSPVTKAVKNGNEESYFDEIYNLECFKLQEIINQCLESRVLITRCKRILHHELTAVIPDLIIHSNAKFTSKEIKDAFQVIESNIIDVLEKWKSSSSI